MDRRAAGPLVGMVAVLALVLGGCVNDGVGLAQQACRHVSTSLALYAEAQRDPHAPDAARKRTEAVAQLEIALPLAARANSADPQFNPLMTTLEDIGTNSEANLVTALRAQCDAVNSPGSTANIPG